MLKLSVMAVLTLAVDIAVDALVSTSMAWLMIPCIGGYFYAIYAVAFREAIEEREARKRQGKGQ